MSAAEHLSAFLSHHPKLLVLSGAGISSESGIPHYRDSDGNWRHQKPVQYQDFCAHRATRARYWARSMIGWLRMSKAQPNRGHQAVAELEARGKLSATVTQNVDGLHQRAGSKNVVDLHGRIDTVVCLACSNPVSRADWQKRLHSLNPDFVSNNQMALSAPDGDAQVDDAQAATFNLADCDACGGIMKPDVVFFGEPVPTERVKQSMDALGQADALLVIGSSLIVYSGFRFARQAKQWGKPIALLNLGFNRASELASLQLDADCSSTLASAILDN